MLARLDEIPGVEATRVDWTGRRFLLALDAQANPEGVADVAAAVLGEGAFVLDPTETRAALHDYRSGEAWMRAGETLRLSRFEAGALAARYGNEAAGELELDASATPRLIELFERELNLAFERTHASQGRTAVTSEIEAAAQRIRAGSRPFLDARQQSMLDDYLRRFAGPRKN